MFPEWSYQFNLMLHFACKNLWQWRCMEVSFLTYRWALHKKKRVFDLHPINTPLDIRLYWLLILRGVAPGAKQFFCSRLWWFSLRYPQPSDHRDHHPYPCSSVCFPKLMQIDKPIDTFKSTHPFLNHLNWPGQYGKKTREGQWRKKTSGTCSKKRWHQHDETLRWAPGHWQWWNISHWSVPSLTPW